METLGFQAKLFINSYDTVRVSLKIGSDVNGIVGVIDSGASNTILSYDCYKQLKNDVPAIPPLKQDFETFTAAGADILRNYGYFTEKITLGNFSTNLKIQVLGISDQLLIGNDLLMKIRECLGSYSFRQKIHGKNCTDDACEKDCKNGPFLVIGDPMVRKNGFSILQLSENGNAKQIKIFKINKEDIPHPEQPQDDASVPSAQDPYNKSQLTKKDVQAIQTYYDKIYPVIKGVSMTEFEGGQDLSYEFTDSNPHDIGNVYDLNNPDIEEKKDTKYKHVEIEHKGSDQVVRKFKIRHDFKNEDIIRRFQKLCQENSRLFNIDDNHYPSIANFEAKLYP